MTIHVHVNITIMTTYTSIQLRVCTCKTPSCDCCITPYQLVSIPVYMWCRYVHLPLGADGHIYITCIPVYWVICVCISNIFRELTTNWLLSIKFCRWWFHIEPRNIWQRWQTGHNDVRVLWQDSRHSVCGRCQWFRVCVCWTESTANCQGSWGALYLHALTRQGRPTHPHSCNVVLSIF